MGLLACSRQSHGGHREHGDNDFFVLLRVLRGSVVCGLEAGLMALALAACGDDGRIPVVLYSPHGRDQLTLLERAFEAERRQEVTKIQAEQNGALQRLGRMQAMAPFLRLIPSGTLAAIGRFLLSRASIKRFIEGASRIELTFKPEGSQR